MSSTWAGRLADVVVVVHLLWVAFMVGGIVVTLAGLYWRRLLGYRRLRWVHMAGLVYSAALGIAGKYCPLTTLEYKLRQQAGVTGEPESLIIRVASKLVFPDISADVLSALAAGAAIVVVVVFVWKPPWRA